MQYSYPYQKITSNITSITLFSILVFAINDTKIIVQYPNTVIFNVLEMRNTKSIVQRKKLLVVMTLVIVRKGVSEIITFVLKWPSKRRRL